ncbi:hypothetical protein D5S17_18540 [Pseudonocardiaceae bacterium YIM PH 21723]|nr:hypothetical protein D5S17_18540 [Pseudonocardiaceae bacterium YIM PH 21723]
MFADRSSDLPALFEALHQFGTSKQRVDELKLLVSDLAQPSAQLLDFVVPDQLHQIMTEINGRIGLVPFVRLQLALHPAVQTCQRLITTETELPVEFIKPVSRVLALAARVAFETRDDEYAQQLYTEAVAVAGRGTDLGHRAAIRTSQTMVTLHANGQVEQARDIARAATVDAHQGDSYAIRARAHAVHAEVCARTGQSGQASIALERAWKSAEQATVGDPHRSFSPDHLSGFEGLCALYSGDAERADERLQGAVNNLSAPREAVERGIVTADLALARLSLGEPAACVELAHQVVDLAGHTTGRVPAQRLSDLRRTLRPWRTEPFVMELEDHIHDTLIGC